MRLKRTCLLLLMAILVVAAASVWFARRDYAAKLIANVWPSGKFAVPMVGVTILGTNTLLLLGDSRMADWGEPGVEGYRVINAGMPGVTTAQMASVTREILEQTHPQLVVIQAGINDLKLVGVRPDLREAIVDGCVSNLTLVAKQCRQAGAQVIILKIWPAARVGFLRRWVWNGQVELAVNDANARLSDAVSGIEGMYVRDPFVRLLPGLSPGQRQQLYRDTLHLRANTYAQLTELLGSSIKTLPQASTIEGR